MVEQEKKDRTYLLPQDIDVKSYVSNNPNATGFFSDINKSQYNTLLKWKDILKDKAIITDWVFYNDLFLLRFLRARKFEIDNTHTMFMKYINWRKDNGVDDIETYDFTEKLKIKEIYPHGYHKTDKLGRPLLFKIISQCNVDEVFTRSNEERIMRYYIKEYERNLLYRMNCCGIKIGKIVEQSVTILCGKDLGISMYTGKVKTFTKISSNLAQDYYPEMLGQMYFINTGFLFSAAWSIVSVFLDAKTTKKIVMLGSDYLTELKKHIDMDNLPKSLGGNCECKDIKGGCFHSDIGPWNPTGISDLVYTPEIFDKVM